MIMTKLSRLRIISRKSTRKIVSYILIWHLNFTLTLFYFLDVSDIPLASFGYLEKEEAIDPTRKLHIQDDGTILAIAATGTSSQDSLISFVRILERENPRLRSIPVIISNKDNS